MSKFEITLIGAFSAFFSLISCFISARSWAAWAFATRLTCFVSFFARQASIFWFHFGVSSLLPIVSLHSCLNRFARSSSDSVRSRFRARLKFWMSIFPQKVFKNEIYLFLSLLGSFLVKCLSRDGGDDENAEELHFFCKFVTLKMQKSKEKVESDDDLDTWSRFLYKVR